VRTQQLVDTAAINTPQDHSVVVPRRAELSGDDGGLFCRCGSFSKFFFAVLDADGSFVIDCHKCFRRLIAYRAPGQRR
jgi:hypothetical protein